MPCNTTSTIRCAGKQPVACGTLVALACLALASCGGGLGAAHPDLVVEDPAVSDPRPAAAASFSFSATVRNAGRGNAAATTLRVYRSDDAAITPSDEQVGAAAVSELAASASGVASAQVTAPSSPGTHYYGACVDPVAGESDSANNCSATVRVVVQAQNLEPASPQPDLVVELPAVSDGSPVAGASFSFSATVRNAGDGDAAAAALHVYRSDDETITPSDEQVADAAVPELAASESMVASAKLNAPSSSGTYYYGACVHAVAEESDTTNNCSTAVQVTVQAAQVPALGPPRPDLVVKRFWVSSNSPPLGGVFELWANVRNRGGAESPYTELRFYRSTDATVTRSDTEVATEWVAPLRIDSTEYIGYEYAYAQAPSSKGTYYYGTCVDAVAGESDTANNCSAAVKVEVSHNSPELWIGGWTVAGSRPAGASITVGIAVDNGGSPSDATTLRLIRLPDRESEPSAGTQVSQAAVPGLVVTQPSPANSVQTLVFQAPATAGVYYYVACVDAVPRESDTTNNCSPATSIEFR
ncbi:MAG: hypothetical protein OXH96_09625 [Spirochaetaceae bacterium]|nr:hypothetical protein [Spirochaetaceae bacterium]